MAKISFTSTGRTFTLEVWEKSYSVEKNTSDVTWELSISGGGTQWYDTYAKVTVNGSVVFNETKGWGTGTFPAKDGSVSDTVTEIAHDSKGKKSISFALEGYSEVYTTQSTSGNLTLTTIPRASSVAVSNYNLDQNISIAIGKKVSTFTSTLTYKIGSRTGTIATKTSNSTYVWEMSSTLISQIKQDNPQNKKVSAIVYCDTYSGDTKIGTTQSATFELTIVDKPTIDNVSIVETIDLIKQYTTSIVKYLSSPQFNITATPSEGTTISTYKVKINDREITSSSAELIANNIQYSYLVDEVRKTKFIVTVTDARGNTSEEYPIEMDFIEYVQLAFNNTDITLTKLNGTSNFVKLHLTGYVYNNLIGETENILSLQYRYKLKNNTTAEWSELKTLTPTLNEDNTFIIDNLQLEDEFDYRENYDIEFYAEDLFLPISYKTIVKTSDTIAKWHKNGAYIKEISTQRALLNGIEMITPNYCVMRTSSKIDFATGSRVKVTGMVEDVKIGDYYVEDDSIVVTNTSLLEVSSHLAGYGAVSSNIQVYEGSTFSTSTYGILFEAYGKGYFCIHAETYILELDPSKTYKICLGASGYNDKDFQMNNGFGNGATSLMAKKIK